MRSSQRAVYVRRRIAEAMRDAVDIHRQLGMITLLEEQWLTARRAAAVVRQHRGVLVANDVGSGKTYVALAVARPLGRLVVIAPAALRDTWERALVNTGMSAAVLGLEALSRCAEASAIGSAEVIIVDESHHLRNPSTRRYTAVAAICARSRVILLSATPLQNRFADIAAQLALFLGHEAWALSAEQLAAFVVRRRSAPLDARLPELDGPHRVALEHEDDLLDELLALPPPLPVSDGGDGGALLVYTLVRRWASSRAALVASLERRLATALAIESALETGRWPTRAELAAWSVADSVVQLAFPELIATTHGEGSAATLLVVVRQHVGAVRDLLRGLRSRPDPDDGRAKALRTIASAHHDEIVIAFSEHAETVRALGRRLAQAGGVAWLTSHGGHTTSGRISRREVLAQLAPTALVAPAERISLLLTTDVLSEGLDLQRASVVVHLDLPWNPARLEQRVGRVRRLGSPHSRVSVYALAPPASSDRLVRVEQRLREKIRLAERSVGVAGRILPSLFASDAEPSAPSAVESYTEVLAIVSKWLAPSSPDTDANGPLDPSVAAVAADFDGYLASVDDGERALLVADVGTGASTESGIVLRAVTAAEGESVDVPRERVSDATRSLARWWELHLGSEALDLRARATAGTRKRALARLASIAAHTPRHERMRVASQMELARCAVTANLSAGSERVLGALVGAVLPDDAWLRALAAFGETHAPARITDTRPVRDPLPLVAMIVFVKWLSTSPRNCLFSG